MNARRVRKGVSPLIAAVLLIAFTMAVAAILTAWVTTFTQEQTDQLGNQSSQQIDCSFAQVNIFSEDYDSNWVNISVENNGQEELGNLSVTALDGSSVLGTDYIEDFTSGSIRGAQVNTSGTEADTVRVAAESCPTVTDSATLG